MREPVLEPVTGGAPLAGRDGDLFADRARDEDERDIQPALLHAVRRRAG